MFKENSKAIYLQIADRICDEVLAGMRNTDDRMPSVREYAAEMQVNPNTMMRTYEYLSQHELIYNKRGIGFFIADGARDNILAMRRESFLSSELFDMFRQLSLLKISPDELKAKYQQYLNNKE